MKKTILFVDDSKIFQRIAIKSFKDKYNLLVASDGSEAMDIISNCQSKNEKIYLILSDVNMPNMGGIELREKVKSNPDLKFIPFYLMSATIDEKEKSKHKNILFKPLSIETLNDLAEKTLNPLEYMKKKYNKNS